jgi:hypothetical protein
VAFELSMLSWRRKLRRTSSFNIHGCVVFGEVAAEFLQSRELLVTNIKNTSQATEDLILYDCILKFRSEDEQGQLLHWQPKSEYDYTYMTNLVPILHHQGLDRHDFSRRVDPCSTDIPSV